MKKLFWVLPVTLACGFSTGGPGSLAQGDMPAVPARRGTVISNGCTLDSWQLEALAELGTKKVVREVVLECLLPHADGSVTPNDAAGVAALAGLVKTLHMLDYTVSLAANFTADDGVTFDSTQTASEIADASWAANVVTGISTAVRAAGADGADLELELLPASSQPDVTRLVSGVAGALHPFASLGLYLPPSTQSPSDVTGGDAFDVATLAGFVDRFHVMTVDFSGPQPGPTIDAGWAVDAVRFAQQSTGNAAVDVAVPLYGNDFTTSLSNVPVRRTSFLEATGLASDRHITPTRAASQEEMFDYLDQGGVRHELWYDDADSLAITLAAWDPGTLPLTVGVVFLGFGQEDPSVWATVAGATK